MTERPVTTRRGFLKISAAAATAAAIGVGIHVSDSAPLEWRGTRGGPDFIHPLTFTLPEEANRQEVALSLIVTTPRGYLVRDLGVRSVTAGTNRIDAPLFYPYEGVVLGEYSYTAVAKGSDFRTSTTTPCGYTMSPFRWLG